MSKVYAPNLTPANLKDWSDGEITRAIRYGIGKEDQALILMPSYEYNHLSESDIAAVVAYLRSLPAVDKANEPSHLGPIAKTLIATNKAPLLAAETIPAKPGYPSKPAEAATPEFGHYLASTACMGCHGPELKGGPIAVGPPDWPPASDLSATGLGKWTEADFVKALREGVNPQGHKLRAPMPIHLTQKFSETEIQALWKYLKTVS